MNATTALSRKGGRLATWLSTYALQDGAFAAMIVLSRIPANLGTAGALAGIALIVAYTLFRIDQACTALWRCRLHLVYPAFAILSVIWAVHPVVTGRAGLQMAVTAFAGLLLSQAARPRAVLVGLFIAFAGYSVISLFVGETRPTGIEGRPALFGLGGEAKNYFADSSSTGALLALAMLAACLERRALIAALGCAGTVVLCVAATERARSAGAMASLGLAGVVLAMMLVLRGRSPAIKAGVVFAILAAFALGVLFFEPLLAMLQELADKDAGLTGRGYLWYRAEFIIAERPWLGVGYFGFWTPANPDAIGLWRHFDIRQEGTAFSFHNSYIQTVVETGYIGWAVLLVSWGSGVLLLLRRFVLAPSLPTCFWLSYLVLEFSKAPVGPIRPAALVAPTIMMFAALGFACYPLVRPSAERRSGWRGLPPFVLAIDGHQRDAPSFGHDDRGDQADRARSGDIEGDRQPVVISAQQAGTDKGGP